MKYYLKNVKYVLYMHTAVYSTTGVYAKNLDNLLTSKSFIAKLCDSKIMHEIILMVNSSSFQLQVLVNHRVVLECKNANTIKRLLSCEKMLILITF